MLEPFYDRVVVRPDSEETGKSAGGLFIPDAARERPQTGTITAAGPGTDAKPMPVAPGDRVMFSRHAGVRVQLEGVDHLVMRADELHGRLP